MRDMCWFRRRLKIVKAFMEMRRIMIVVEYSIKCCCARFESEDFAILNFVFVALPLTNPQSAIDLLQVFHDTQSGSEVGLRSAKLQCISIFRGMDEQFSILLLRYIFRRRSKLLSKHFAIWFCGTEYYKCWAFPGGWWTLVKVERVMRFSTVRVSSTFPLKQQTFAEMM